ncbi:MAG TPA: hypothetical protein VLB67_02785 [Acidimicrobiia bacterium]|nr:hypothetical protein [Acidimicrobiia bacterium]
MNRVRRAFDLMSPSQRATLGLLLALVFVTAVVAVAATVARSGGNDQQAATTVSTATSTTTSTSTTTTTAPTTTSTSTTPTTSTTSTSTTSTTVPAFPTDDLLLRADGVGRLRFGDPWGEVLDVLLELLGAPDEDSGWVDQASHYGICLGDEVRFVRWGTFQVFFTDGPSDWRQDGIRHFASYSQSVYFAGRELDLVTVDGVSLGTAVGDVRAILGAEAVTDDPIYGPVFSYDPPGPGWQWGFLSGLEPDDVVEVIFGSIACGE